jgi:hypothetical protein
MSLRTAGGVVVVLLAGAALLYTSVFRDEDAHGSLPRAPRRERDAELIRPASQDATLVPAGFAIDAADGLVEVRRGGAWFPVRTGDLLAPQEAIRTADDAHATLHTPQGDELKLRPRVELELSVLDRTVTELTLTRGKLRAQVARDRARFAIRAGEAQVSSGGGGKFTVYADARGAVTVATEDGEVKVLARGGDVTVAAGQQSYVPPQLPPRPPEAIPDAVFLDVDWPDGELHARSTFVKGQATPGSTVEVNGAEAQVGEDGRFRAEVKLVQGDNRIGVRAESIDGRTVEKTGSVRADTRGPPLEADPEKMYVPR